MADDDRTVLTHYNLTTLFPTEWPADKDDSDVSEDEKPQKPNPKAARRYTRLERAPGNNRNATPSSRKSKDGIVSKDESDPLGSSKSVVEVLKRRGMPVEDDVTFRNRFLLSSTTFSPTLFLSEVHSTDSTESLMQGLDFLSRSIEQKSASLKVLVESNFERFVRAKATIDNVYTEMRNHGRDAAAEKRPHSRNVSNLSNSGRTHFRSISGGPQSPIGGRGAASSLPINDKRKNALIRETEYGLQGIKVPLAEATVKAEEVWGPALGGRDKEENLRAVLGSMEKHRPIFDVGLSIEDCIKRRDYDMLAEDYAKAQRFANEAKAIADRAKQNETRLTDPQVHQIVITARIWQDIQTRIEEFRRDTWRRLAESHYSKTTPGHEGKTEEYMELIAVLLQIGVDQNPILEWLSAHYEFLRNKISGTFERARVELEILRRRLSSSSKPSAKVLTSYLRAAATNRNKDQLSNLDTPQVIHFWDKICSSLNTLLRLQGGVLGDVIEYWDTSKSFIDGKKQRSLPVGIDGQSRQHHRFSEEESKNLRRQALELVGLIREQVYALFVEGPIDDISALFTPGPPLTPKTPGSASPSMVRKFNFDAKDIPPPSPHTGEVWEKYAFWPPHSNSLSAVNYLSKIMTIIGTGAAEMASVEMVKQDSNLVQNLRTLVGDIRERSITAICAAWLHDSENCRELEDWVRSREKRDITNMPQYFSAFEMSLVTNLQKIVYISDVSNTTGTAEVILPPPNRHVEAVQKSFKNSLFKAFSGMMEHAARPVTPNSDALDADGLTIPAIRDAGASADGNVIDATSSNVRKLLTMSNFLALRNDIIPQLTTAFESNYSLTISEDAKIARDVLNQMNARVFQAYVRPSNESLKALITNGISAPNYAPADPSQRPTDARPYVYEVLLNLVLVHTEVSRTAPAMLSQILSYLLEQLSQALIDAFKSARARYTLSALMQATLDVEFLSQTLSNYTTEKASEIQGQIYLALDERTDNDARQRLQNELPEMRTILKKLREKTKGEFACFKRAHRSKPKEGERGREREREGTK